MEKYLNKCIDSILKQTFQDFELILVDDGSPDKCPKICDEYAKKDKRVRVIHKENAGLVAARNTGIKEAKGDYICYVDGDDWISENLLQIVWSKAVSKYDVEMVVYSAVRQFTDTQEQIPKSVPEGLYLQHYRQPLPQQETTDRYHEPDPDGVEKTAGYRPRPYL